MILFGWKEVICMETYEVVLVFVVEAKNVEEAVQKPLKGEYRLWSTREAKQMDPDHAEMAIHTMYPRLNTDEK